MFIRIQEKGLDVLNLSGLKNHVCLILTEFFPALSGHGLRSPDACFRFLLGALLDGVPPPEVEHGHDLVPEALLGLPGHLRPRSLVPSPESEAVVPGDTHPQPRYSAPPCPPIISWKWDRLMKIESHIKTSLVNRTVNMNRVISQFFTEWEMHCLGGLCMIRWLSTSRESDNCV